MRKKIFVTGGAGYVGNVLCPHLLDSGYEVTCYDACFFGKDTLPLRNPTFRLVEGDIRDTSRLAEAMKDHDAVLHLACVSNDPSFELDEALSKSINYDCFEPMVVAAKGAGVKRFVYCSTSSVYGISDAPEVTEEHPLVPLTLYNKFKGLCEPLLFEHMESDFVCVAIRPATVCGYSSRCRLDLTVNILTNYAVNKGQITVFGGTQKRPNLHIQDMCDVYRLMLEAPEDKIAGQVFNVGHQNLRVMEIAERVAKVVEEEFPDRGPIQIVRTETDDKRSYHISSDKIARILGFTPKRSVEDAVKDLCAAFRADKLPNSFEDDSYYNVRHLQARKAA